jgi:glutamate-ammonia-ligase adenylyltransferase
VDIEFLTQMLQLRYGHQHREVRSPATHAALRLLAEAGFLPRNHYQVLSTTYNFERDLENRLRLLTEVGLFDLPEEADDGRRTLERMFQFRQGNFSATDYLREYQLMRAQVRAIYQEYFPSC